MLYRNIILLVGLLGFLNAEGHGWSFDETSYKGRVVFYETPTIDGIEATNNDVLGAFYGDQCLGYSSINNYGTLTSVDIHILDAQHPTYIPEGEQPTFKIYDADRDAILDLNVDNDVFVNGIEDNATGSVNYPPNAICHIPGEIIPTVSISNNNIDISWEVPYIDSNGNGIYDEGDSLDGYQPLSFLVNESLVYETDTYEQLSYSLLDLDWCNSYPVSFSVLNNCGESSQFYEVYNFVPNQPGIIDILESEPQEGAVELSWEVEPFSDEYTIYMDQATNAIPVETNIEAFILNGTVWNLETIVETNFVPSSFEMVLYDTIDETNISITDYIDTNGNGIYDEGDFILEANTNYKFYVEGKNCNGEISPQKSEITIQTDPVNYPANINISADDGRIMLDWDEVVYANEVAEYNVYITSLQYTDPDTENVGFQNELYFIDKVSSNSMLVPYLEEATYCFKIQSETSYGKSDYSNEVCKINEGTTYGIDAVDWGIQVIAELTPIAGDEVKFDIYNLLGIDALATDGVDYLADYDVEEPPVNDEIQLKFLIDNNYYTTDIREPKDLESSTESWDMFFEPGSNAGFLSLTFYYINNNGFFNDPDRNIPYLYFNDEFTMIEDGMRIDIPGLVSEMIGDNEPPLSIIVGNAVPNPPINVIAEPGYREISISWQASDSQNINFPASEYHVFRNCGVCENNEDPVAVVSETTYTDRGLDADTEYSYSIKGKNIAGIGSSSLESSTGTGCDNSGYGCATTYSNRAPIADAGHNLVVYFDQNSNQETINFTIPISSSKNLNQWTVGVSNQSFDSDNYYLIDGSTVPYGSPLDSLSFDWEPENVQSETLDISIEASNFVNDQTLNYILTVNDQNITNSTSSDEISVELREMPKPAQLSDNKIQVNPNLTSIEIEWYESSFTGESYIDKNRNDEWTDSEILFDCGLDNVCPGSPGYTMPDEDGTEGNGKWDFEDFNLNFKYDGSIIDGLCEDWVELDGNGVFDSGEEQLGNILLEEDCIYNWNQQDKCFRDIGNEVYDYEEPFLDEPNSSGYYNGTYDSGSQPRPPFFGFDDINNFSDNIATSYEVFIVNDDSVQPLAEVYRFNCMSDEGDIIDAEGVCGEDNIGASCGSSSLGICTETTGNDKFSFNLTEHYNNYPLDYNVDYCFYIDAKNSSGSTRSNQVCSQLASLPTATILYPSSSKVFESGDSFDMLLDIENGNSIKSIAVYQEVDEGVFANGQSHDRRQIIDFSPNELESGILTIPIGSGLVTRQNEDVSDNIYIKISITDIADNIHNIYSGFSCIDNFEDVVPGTADQCTPENIGSNCGGENSGAVCKHLQKYSVASSTQSKEIGEGWNLFGSPLSVSGNDSQLLEDNINIEQGFILAFDQYQNQNNINIVSGEGYYLYLVGTNNGSSEIEISGDVLSDFSIPLESGWNLISNPLPTSIMITDLEIDTGTNILTWEQAVQQQYISSSLIGFNNTTVSHVNSKKMEPFQGYWIHSGYSGINLKVSLPSPDTSESLANSMDAQFEFILSSRDANNPGSDSMGDQIVLSIKGEPVPEGYSYGEDQYHLPINSNLTPSFTAMYIDRQDWVDQGLVNQRQFFKDTRTASQSDYTWEIKGVPNGVWGLIRLSWDKSVIDNLDQDVSLNLITSENSVIYKLDNNNGTNHHTSIDLDGEKYYLDVQPSEFLDFVIEYKDSSVTEGCMNPNACNFNRDATKGNSLEFECEYDSCQGCDEPDAVNYNINHLFYTHQDGTPFWRACGENNIPECCEYTGFGLIFERYEAMREIFIESTLQNEIPIILKNPENQEISSLDLVFEFDQSILNFTSSDLGFRVSETLEEDGNLPVSYEFNVIDGNKLKLVIFLYHETPINDSKINLGALLPTINNGISLADINTESVISMDAFDIKINDQSISDGLDLYLENGPFILKEGYFNFQGKIYYPHSSNAFTIDNVDIRIEGTPKYNNFLKGQPMLVDSAVTSSEGIFEFNNIIKGDYSLTFHKTSDVDDNSVTSNDAAKVAQRAVEMSDIRDYYNYLWTSNSWHNPAGNVNFNLKDSQELEGFKVDDLGGADCANIAKYAIGLIENINDDDDESGEQGKNWIFGINHTASSEIFNPVNSDSTSSNVSSLGYKISWQNGDYKWESKDHIVEFNFDNEQDLMDNKYVGVRVGDATLNWPDLNNLSSVSRKELVENKISIDVNDSDVISFPIYVDQNYCGSSIDIDISYDGFAFSMIDFVLSDNIQNNFTVFDNREEDRFRLAAFNTHEVCNISNQIGTAVFQVLNSGPYDDQYTSIKSILINGENVYSGFVVDNNYSTLYQELVLNDSGLPDSYNLYQNYPNPFNPKTNIKFDLPNDDYVTMNIFDINGRLVETLYRNDLFQAGYHSIVWDASSFPSGIYFLKFNSDQFTSSSKLILVK